MYADATAKLGTPKYHSWVLQNSKRSQLGTPKNYIKFRDVSISLVEFLALQLIFKIIK